MNDVVIEFKDVWKHYPLYRHVTSGFKNLLFTLPTAVSEMRRKRFFAVKAMTFKVHRGDAFGIIGRNGAGKSTILSLMAGIIFPSRGLVTAKGRMVALLELGAGFHPELTGRENIVLNGILMGLRKKEVQGKLDKIVEFSGIGDYIDQPLRTYSNGMLARLGFSVVSHIEGEIFLIDEILAVGDMEFQKKCHDKIMEFKEKKATIVLVSHNMADIEMFCDRVMWIDGNSIKMFGAADEVVEAYTRYQG